MIRAALVVALVATLPACADERPDGASVVLDRDHLACPSETLRLTITGGFAAGTMVSFVMGDRSYDGSAVVLADGSIACGLPSDAPVGSYDLDITEPDGGETHLADAVTLDATTCP